MPGVTKEGDSFQSLVHALSEKLGPCSGIDSADVDETELQQLMEDYVSDESEWEKYFFPASNMAYTRNLVDKGNGKSNLLILVWSPGRASPIHEIYPLLLTPRDEATFVAGPLIDASPACELRHANAHCIMKILKGSLTETRYAWPTVDRNKGEESPLQIMSSKTFEENQVTYMSDKLGLHRISNPNADDYAVSLHLYTPPNAAVYGCNVFNEANGQSTHINKCTTFSEYGARPGAA